MVTFVTLADQGRECLKWFENYKWTSHENEKENNGRQYTHQWAMSISSEKNMILLAVNIKEI